MGLKEMTAKLRESLTPTPDLTDPAADADDVAPLAEDAPPTLAADVRPGAGERRRGTPGSRPESPR